MVRKRFVLPIIGGLFVAVVVLTKCDNDKPKEGASDSTNTHLNAPAPDNNSATNPSTADTAFQKDSTARKKDSVR